MKTAKPKKKGALRRRLGRAVLLLSLIPYEFCAEEGGCGRVRSLLLSVRKRRVIRYAVPKKQWTVRLLPFLTDHD